jgi:ribosomal protein S12 methylthiotransferase
LDVPKNRVDSEQILSMMTSSGFLYTEDLSQAGIMIVNTCAFIEPAVEESIDTILDFRAENSEAYLIVVGCLTMRYGDDLKDTLPEVDLFLNPAGIADLPQIILSTERTGPHEVETTSRCSLPVAEQRILTTPGYAYLKVAEGCSRRCRYCTIPAIRGALRSRDLQGLEQEAFFLASKGIREIVLVAQDLTTYGTDRGEKGALIRLLERLRRIQGIEWIRLMYLHPAGIPAELAGIINESPNILPYLDIPFQHVSESVLKAMGRPWRGGRMEGLVDRLRNEIHGLVLRTTLIVGFPGEGEKEFSELRSFVESTGIEHVGVFTYSPEEGTRAMDLGDPVPMETKTARAEELRNVHLRFTEKRNRSRVGSMEQCIVEGVSVESDLLLQGRTWDQAPEVDGALYITAGTASVGEILDIAITDSFGPDLFGEIV